MNHPDFPSLANLAGPSSPDRLASTYTPLTDRTLNLENELLAQYNTAKKLIHDAEYAEDVPLNQKAQAVNSATAVLGALIKSQSELYNLERVKKIEAVLLRTLQSFPDMQEAFMRDYSAALED
jgi:hypothetical protein